MVDVIGFFNDIIKYVYIYRAVCLNEYLSIIDISKFTLHLRKTSVKYFGLNFDETLLFANKAFNLDIVAIFEVKLKEKDLNQVGDFTKTDPFLFRTGTVEIQEENLDQFNEYIIKINHIY